MHCHLFPTVVCKDICQSHDTNLLTSMYPTRKKLVVLGNLIPHSITHTYLGLIMGIYMPTI